MIAAEPGASVHLRRAVPASSAMPITFFVTVPEPGHEYLDLLHGGHVVARLNTIDCRTRLWIEHVHVQPGDRGHGHGRRLLETLFARHPRRTFALSCGPFEWSAQPVTQPGLGADALAAWYGRLGFRPDPEWPHAPELDPERVLVRSA